MLHSLLLPPVFSAIYLVRNEVSEEEEEYIREIEVETRNDKNFSTWDMG
jgi:hypothetical protein